MNKRFDILTVALTGQLAIVLITAAVLALVLSLFILWRYRRAVIKSMRRRSRSEILEPTGYMPPDQPQNPPGTELEFTFPKTAKRNPLYRRARRRPHFAALIYGIAGISFAATMATAFLLSAKITFLPWRLLYLIWVHAWPAVLTINLVATVTRRGQLIVPAVYLLGGAMLGVLLLERSPDLTIAQLAYPWFNANAIPSLLLLLFLNRRIRAVGPLLLVLMFFGAAGATLVVSLAGNHPTWLRGISDLAHSLGLGAQGTMWSLHLVGFALFGIVGWLTLDALRRMYEFKQISDQTVTIDSVWLLFGVVTSMGLVFQGARWILSGLAAFVIFKLVAATGFMLLGARRRYAGPRLLLLRVFALGRRSERLYSALDKQWRTVGSIQMIAGPDLAAMTVEPHEFLDFLAGRLSRRFIDSGHSLDLRISQMDVRADGDGRFRVTEFFCHDDTWKLALARLAEETDAVLMDLRGFSESNAGCVYEVNELFNLVPLQRVVFVIDDSTDQAFMCDTMRRAWRQIRERSPNRRLSPGRVSLVQLSRRNAANMRILLYAISAAASASSSSEPDEPSAELTDPQDFSW